MKPGNRVEDKTLKTGEILACGECPWQRTRRLTDGHIQLTLGRSHLMSSLGVPMFAVGTREAVDERRWRYRQGAELELRSQMKEPAIRKGVLESVGGYRSDSKVWTVNRHPVPSPKGGSQPGNL